MDAHFLAFGSLIKLTNRDSTKPMLIEKNRFVAPGLIPVVADTQRSTEYRGPVTGSKIGAT